MKKRWKVKGRASGVESRASTSLRDLLFTNRGIESDEAKAAFLSPDFDRDTHDPFLFRHMRVAVDRIFYALENGEKITVHGDYDADGVTGSAVLMTTLKKISAQPRHLNQKISAGGVPLQVGCAVRSAVIDSYIPHRDKEGYGMNTKSVHYIHDSGTSLIITVDCGIANVAEIALAKSLGIDTIVVDHHQFGEELPDAILIHPKLPDEIYPFPHLAAVGVAWKLACALVVEARRRGIEIPNGWEKWLLDFVSIATVTDMVPLIGENRVLETYGLKVLNKTRRPGLLRLIENAEYRLGTLTTESVAFGLGPRINAAGRMDHASLALELLLSESEEEAEMLARQIEERNRERQRAMKAMMEEAERHCSLMGDPSGRSYPIIILWSPTWSPSLVGLVAGKYLDKTGKPTIAIGKCEDKWIGSGRSFAEYDITAAVRVAGEGLLARAGGHVQACGFSFTSDDHLPLLVERLQSHAASRLREEDCLPMIEIDAEIPLDEVSWQLVELLRQFEPYGEANKKPLLLSRGLIVVACDLIGREQNHARLLLRSPSGRTEKFIGFKFGDRANEIEIGKQIDVVYDVGVNTWNGRTEIQCKLVDFEVSFLE